MCRFDKKRKGGNEGDFKTAGLSTLTELEFYFKLIHSRAK